MYDQQGQFIAGADAATGAILRECTVTGILYRDTTVAKILRA